jgi:hypothetical protein
MGQSGRTGEETPAATVKEEAEQKKTQATGTLWSTQLRQFLAKMWRNQDKTTQRKHVHMRSKCKRCCGPKSEVFLGRSFT